MIQRIAACLAAIVVCAFLALSAGAQTQVINCASGIQGSFNAACNGLNHIRTSVAAASLVLKASPGNLFSVYATNMSSAAGTLMVFNSVSEPSDGTVTPYDCIPIAANNVASLNYGVGPPEVFSTGIVAVVSVGTSCFTKNTAGASAFINGAVQ